MHCQKSMTDTVDTVKIAKTFACAKVGDCTCLFQDLVTIIEKHFPNLFDIFLFFPFIQVSQLFRSCNVLLVTFRVKNIVSFCVKKSLHFASKNCYILRRNKCPLKGAVSWDLVPVKRGVNR